MAKSSKQKDRLARPDSTVKPALIEVCVTARSWNEIFKPLALSNGGHIDQIAFYLLSFSIMNWRYRRQILDPPLYGDNGS